MTSIKTQTTPKKRASYLTVSQAYDLDIAVAPVTKALWPLGHYGIFQVGSSLLRGDWRDVDLRCIMEDAKFDSLFGKKFSLTHLFLNTAILHLSMVNRPFVRTLPL